MNEEVNGYVIMNVYLVFDKIKLVDRNSRYVNARIDLEVLVASFGYEYEETFDHLKHASLEYVAERFPDGMNSFIDDFTLGIENISAAICNVDTFLKSDSEQFLGDGFTVNDTNIGNIRLDFDTVTLCDGGCACATGGEWFTLGVIITSELDKYDMKNYVHETCKRLLDKFIEIGNCHRVHVSRDERFAFEIAEN